MPKMPRVDPQHRAESLDILDLTFPTLSIIGASQQVWTQQGFSNGNCIFLTIFLGISQSKGFL